MVIVLLFGPTNIIILKDYRIFQNMTEKVTSMYYFTFSGGTKSLMITENKAIHVGEPLELSCSTAGFEPASLRIKNVSSGQIVANSYGPADKLRGFILKRDDHQLDGQLAVRINLTQLSDGGMYECDEISNVTLSAVSTRVVVLG